MIEWHELADGFGEGNEAELGQYVQQQRWFGGKNRTISGVTLRDLVVLREDPRLAIVLIDVRFDAGTTDIYQLTLSSVHVKDDSHVLPVVTTVQDIAICDASGDPEIAYLVATATGDGKSFSGQSGELHFRAIREISGVGQSIRPLLGEQSNTSFVLNEQVLLKVYRRLEAGTNPELELLLFLTEHDFAHIPQLAGWYSYDGSDLRSTLGLAQQFVPHAIDGWELGLDELSRAPHAFLERLGRLGEVVGEMHCVLASDALDSDFSPEVPTNETTAILGARLEEQIESLAAMLTPSRSDDLRALARRLTHVPNHGKLIRTHGDLHLGQVLWANDDWWVIDFEGEPARSLSERRQKFPPLRDIAGLLRSFSYLVAAFQMDHSPIAHADWEAEARERLLNAYRAQVGPAGLLPDDLEIQDRQLRLFELEKILYELDYEAQHRPSWLPVPLAGIDRLLDGETP